MSVELMLLILTACRQDLLNESCGSPNTNANRVTSAARQHDSHYFTVSEIDWASTCPWPSSFIDHYLVRSCIGIRNISVCCDNRGGSKRLYKLEGESRERHRGSVVLQRWIHSQRLGSVSDPALNGSRAWPSAYRDIKLFIDRAIVSGEVKGTYPEVVSSIPSLHWQIKCGLFAGSDPIRYGETSNYMRSSGECSILSDKESRTFDGSKNIITRRLYLPMHADDWEDGTLDYWNCAEKGRSWWCWRDSNVFLTTTDHDKERTDKTKSVAHGSGSSSISDHDFTGKCTVDSTAYTFEYKCPEP